VKRRDFITLLGGVAAAWPLAAGAQQPEQVRRIGVLMSVAADGPEGPARLAAFRQGLQQSSWTDGRNVDLVIRWGAGDAERIRSYAAELVALGPDVILASGDIVGVALRQATRTVPIVFTLIADPVGAGLVESLARPGSNIIGTQPAPTSGSNRTDAVPDCPPAARAVPARKWRGATFQFRVSNRACHRRFRRLAVDGLRPAGQDWPATDHRCGHGWQPTADL
jgi:putative tryptophan/tyrosine transport system substrate-binding protein